MIDLPDNLGEIIQSVDAGTGAANRLVSLAASLKSLLKKSEAGTDPDVKGVLAEIANEVADTKIANASLKEQLAALRSELEALKAFDDDLSNYALTATPGGAIVYEHQEPQSAGLPPHFICPNCAGERRKIILQIRQHYTNARCPRCDTSFQVVRAGA